VKIIPLFFVLAFAGVVHAQPLDACMQAYNDEVVAIEREAKAKQNVGGNAAKQRAARGGETQLAAAARRAKKCQEDAKAPGDAAKAAGATQAAADDCKARTGALAGDIERRFGSETLDPAQQASRREAEIRLQAALNECNRRAK
jgi:hypothetical protein